MLLTLWSFGDVTYKIMCTLLDFIGHPTFQMGKVLCFLPGGVDGWAQDYRYRMTSLLPTSFLQLGTVSQKSSLVPRLPYIGGFHSIFSLDNWRALHHHVPCWLVNIHITWHFCPSVSMVKDAMESVYRLAILKAVNNWNWEWPMHENGHHYLLRVLIGWRFLHFEWNSRTNCRGDKAQTTWI